MDYSGLILIESNFSRVHFYGYEASFSESNFYGRACFDQASFYCDILFEKTYFDDPTSFRRSIFKGNAAFRDVEFAGGASFSGAEFQNDVTFEKSKFEEMHYLEDRNQTSLADFRGAKFMEKASFLSVRFGSDGKPDSKMKKWERVVDFTGTEFKSTTDFRKVVFAGAPAFFNAQLHEDTNFDCVDWRKAETDSASVGYAIRAWERLELEMSKREKPLERHLFFRLKMRARRRADPWFLRFLNWLFEQLADYGWGVGRACIWWLGHWVVFAVILFTNACFGKSDIGVWELIWAALGTSFANAHVFLFLTAEGGYLESGRKLLENNGGWGLLTVVGTVESILGPIFLFFLLLTLRNRFRLA